MGLDCWPRGCSDGVRSGVLSAAAAGTSAAGEPGGGARGPGRAENLRSLAILRQHHSGSVIGMSSHISCRKVPMKKDMNDIRKIAAGKM